MEPKTTTTKEEERRGPKITVDNYVETEEMRQQAEVQARKNIRATNVPEINLSEEELKSYGVYQDSEGSIQQGPLTHAVVSFLTPAFGHVCTGNTYGLKIYSAHCNESDATEMAKKIRDYHVELYGKAIYAILVMEMGKLVTIPSTKEELNRLWTNRTAADDYLNELISNYRIEQEKSKILFDIRKDTLKASANEFSALERARQLREASNAIEEVVEEADSTNVSRVVSSVEVENSINPERT
jgi:hypothetical protein